MDTAFFFPSDYVLQLSFFFFLEGRQSFWPSLKRYLSAFLAEVLLNSTLQRTGEPVFVYIYNIKIC